MPPLPAVAQGRFGAACTLLLLACGDGRPSAESSNFPGPEAITESSVDDEYRARTVASTFVPRSEQGWEECDENTECALLQVPLDHSDPSGPELTLFLTRIRALDDVPLRGTLVVNAGVSGALAAMWLSVNDAVNAFPGYDLVVFGPRGAGIVCENIAEPAFLYEASGVEGVIEAFRATGQGCASDQWNQFTAVGTMDSVQDLEVIRRFLGMGPLNFLGVGHGTRLGALYAARYPEQLRALLLDRPEAPDADLVELTLSQFELAVNLNEQFLSSCESAELTCPQDVRGVLSALIEEARRQGTLPALSRMWRANLASSTDLSEPAAILLEFARDPEATLTALRYARDSTVSGFALFEEPHNPSVINEPANLTVRCTDNTRSPLGAGALQMMLEELGGRSELFAASAFGVAACTGWPHASRPASVRVSAGSPPPPSLIIGGVRDIVTSFAYAKELHQRLPSSVVVTSNRLGHGVTVPRSECAIGHMRDYLLDLELPEDGTVCD